ncbi:MAG TPA: alpha/beta hydrolase [Kofleriaceae bacterium]|nr:alpha/beta hydrolase [Kofleriaceae bacterium]
MPVGRVLLVPRWNGRGDSDFYPWLAAQLAAAGWRGEVETAALRPPEAPEVEATVASVRGRLGAAGRAARTVLVGHSVGAQAAMRALAEPGPPVAGLLLVAGWWTVDRPWPALQRWIDAPFDWARTRERALRRVVLVSTDDPFTADAARTRRLFEERLGAEVRVHDRAGHFNQSEEPAVLAALRDLVAPLS